MLYLDNKNACLTELN